MSDAAQAPAGPPGQPQKAPPGGTPPKAAPGGARITAVTSGKGGVGKTFVTANLAAALARRGERVLVLDADLGLANLDVVLNLYSRVTLHDVFTGRTPLEDAILPAPGGFSVLLAGSGLIEYSRMTPEVRDKLLEVITKVRPRYDHVLLDTGAGISDVVLFTISLADEVLIVATPEPTSLADAYATVKVLAATQAARPMRLLVNQTERMGEGRTVRAQLQQVVDRFVNAGLPRPVKLDHIGDVPQDKAVRETVQRRLLLLESLPGCAAAQALVAAANKLLD
ncbi:MAG: MinD/ParA family protein [Burkholderiales bacterium]|nr:MinD/ParA family protein [Burkholderiales bacterium]